MNSRSVQKLFTSGKFVSVNMFKLLSFKKILLFANAVMNLSGFLCISIDPNSFKRRKSFWNNLYFIVTIVFSLAAYSFRSVLPIRSITHSHILEVLVNTLNTLMVFSLFIFKVFNIFQYREYQKILENLQSCNLNVRL